MRDTSLLALGATALACVLAVGGAAAWATGQARQQALVDRLALPPGGTGRGRGRRFARLDAQVRRSRFGPRLERRIAATGLPLTPGEFTAAALGLTLALWVVAHTVLAPFFGPIAAGLGLWASFAFLNWRRQVRIERFINQLPELARVLANAAQAGLALRTAVSMAAEELQAPAGEELTQVANALALGHSLEDALKELQDRLPSRELAVLVTTLVLSARTGGALVNSLRNLTETLEERKETRREVRTQLAQIRVTAYAVPVLGIGALLMIDQITPGALAAMTGGGAGRAAVVVALGLYALGFFLIHRMSRIEV
ncbi:type II secretion system F family protein [Streptomyces capparidis]